MIASDNDIFSSHYYNIKLMYSYNQSRIHLKRYLKQAVNQYKSQQFLRTQIHHFKGKSSSLA